MGGPSPLCQTLTLTPAAAVVVVLPSVFSSVDSVVFSAVLVLPSVGGPSHQSLRLQERLGASLELEPQSYKVGIVYDIWHFSFLGV